MSALLLLPTGSCLVIALGALVTRAELLRRHAGTIAATIVLASGLALDAAVLGGDTLSTLDGQLRGDALSAFMLTVVGAVGLTATWSGLGPRSQPGPTRSYAALVVLFLGAMSTAVLADNLGVLWVAVEATTIATAFLVGHHRTRRALEAAWKYVVLGSVGVAIAFLGIVLLYAATRSAGSATLSWSVLAGSQLALDPSLVRLAAGLTILGFATKAGLAPMHSWLPDAHSQAPAPVSGLMSGVLLSVAFYAILRVQAIAAPVIGTAMMRGMLVTAGVLSLTVATLLLIAQRDLKRMLAYSSVEHMGVLALAAAIGGPLAIAAALLHVLGHGLAKSCAFVASGWILETEGTTRLDNLGTLLRRRPGVAVPFLVAMTALLGLPPFSVFFSEVAIVVAGVQQGMYWVMAVTVLLLLAAFAALGRHVASIAFGVPETRSGTPAGVQPGDGTAAAVPDWSTPGLLFPVWLALGATAVAGFVAGPFATLLTDAAGVLGTGR